MAITPPLPADGSVTVFGTDWCPWSRSLKAGLDQAGVDYTLVDVDEDLDAGEFVKSVNDGNRVVPTVLYADGTTETNPSAETVTARVR